MSWNICLVRFGGVNYLDHDAVGVLLGIKACHNAKVIRAVGAFLILVGPNRLNQAAVYDCTNGLETMRPHSANHILFGHAFGNEWWGAVMLYRGRWVDWPDWLSAAGQDGDRQQ
jgi:hypothetical protein